MSKLDEKFVETSLAIKTTVLSTWFITFGAMLKIQWFDGTKSAFNSF